MSLSTISGLTCEFCLDARQWKCKGAPCARWERDNATKKGTPTKSVGKVKRDKPPTFKRVRTPEQKAARRYPNTDKVPGGQRGVRGVSAEVQHLAALDLVEGGFSKSEIAHRQGLKLEQVRTVERGLKAFAQALVVQR